MAKPKFLDLLGDFDQRELSDFGKYLKTAHANEKVAIRAFDYFKKYHPGFEDEKRLDLEYAAQKIFQPGDAALQSSRKSLLNAFHDLYALLKKFLLTRKLEEESLESEILWLSVLRQRRGMKTSYEKALSNLLERIKTAPKTDTLDYLKCVAASYLSCYHVPERKKADSTALLDLDRELDHFYDICRLKINSEKLNRQRQQGGGEAPLTTPKKPEAATRSAQPLQVLYGRVHDLQSGGSDAEYGELEAALTEYAGQISKEEMYDVFGYLKNYCSIQLRNGEYNIWEKAHRLDKFALQHRLFWEESKLISVVQFFNIVNAAGNVGAFEWAEDFIDRHLPSMEESIRYEVAALSSATLLFSKKEYGKVLQKLNIFEDHRLKSTHLVLRQRALKLMCMYELDPENERLWDEAMSFEALLRRDSSPREEAVSATLNFLSVFKKLIFRKKSREQLISEVKETAKPLYFKAWLLQKMKDYKPFNERSTRVPYPVSPSEYLP